MPLTVPVALYVKFPDKTVAPLLASMSTGSGMLSSSGPWYGPGMTLSSEVLITVVENASD